MSALAMGAVAGALASSAARRISSSSASASALNEAASSSGGGAAAKNEKNVGILAVEVYTPSTYVSQESLEEHCGASKGRYTIGLGQDGLALCGDCEDVNSLSLTVVHSLLEKYGVDLSEIGRLEVGTETLVDKSKSTKTILMDLFPSNADVEGATVVNACYGGTAALLNAFAWVESDGWDGRYALVVAADVATYARGPARPTCGAGAVAALIGRDAPLAFADPRERATHATNVWDFFKPDHAVEHPTVDGALSQVCYYRALEDCYNRFADKIDKFSGVGDGKEKGAKPFDAESADYFVFHAPYNKLVQKSYGRLYLLDARRRRREREERERRTGESSDDEEKKENGLRRAGGSSTDEGKNEEEETTDNDPLEEWLTKPIEETYSDRSLESTLKKLSSSSFKERLSDANAASKAIGNTYAASVFFGIASLIDKVGSRGELTEGKTAVVFSYGSGAIATMYRLHVREPTRQTRFTIPRMASALSLTSRLDSRELVHPSELDHALETRARMHRAGAPYSPVYPTVGRLFPGTYYLNGVDSRWRRSYSRVPLDAVMDPPGTSLAPPIVLRLGKRDEVSCPVTGKLEVLVSSEEGCSDRVTEAKRRVACVITGIAAGLPRNGRDDDDDYDGDAVFRPDNMTRLVTGDCCITPVDGSTKMAMLEKNVVQTKKLPDGTIKRIPVKSDADIIQLAGRIGTVDLPSSYGVPPGLAETMDVAAQVAVAAGMEALKSAGLVSGRSDDPREWKVSDRYRDTTGVVYASSFPAMDAAVGEVMRFLQSKTVGAADTTRLISALRNRMLRASPERELSDDDEAAFARLHARAKVTDGAHGPSEEEKRSSSNATGDGEYVFDRKFLFRVLVLGNAQLAQLSGCRGPNTQTNAACAGTTQAIAMAQDMLVSGRAERVLVVAGDNASGSTLLPWLGSGFRALGAATTEPSIEDAACPFDRRRSGMLLGAGGIGMVLETEASSQERLLAAAAASSSSSSSSSSSAPKAVPPFEVKARLLATQYSNSAYHGAALDRRHIASELKRFLADVELIHGICKAEIATHGVYFSHETGTHATSASSCAGNEVAALRDALGDDLLSKMLILNTKGFTGHPMGVSFEDVTAVEVLTRQVVPPVPNHRVEDEYLGELNLSRGGPYACRYALRFAAGFGSQVAFALYATAQYE